MDGRDRSKEHELNNKRGLIPFPIIVQKSLSLKNNKIKNEAPRFKERSWSKLVICDELAYISTIWETKNDQREK